MREPRSSTHSTALLLTFVAFGMLGLMLGAWQVALPDLQRSLRLSPGALGAALTLGFLAIYPTLYLGNRLAERHGARAILVVTALLLSLAFLGLTVVNSYWFFVALLLPFYGGVGGFDMGMNAAAIGVEQITGRRVMAYLHAAFSGLAAVGALTSGLLIAAGVPYRLLYLILAGALAGLALLIWRSTTLPGPAAPVAKAETPGGLALYRIPAIVILAVVAGLSFMSEGTLETWSAIYLRAGLGLPALVGAAGPTIFHTAMTLGRITSGRVLARLGRRTLLLAAGLSAAGGVTLALATTQTPVILAGLLVAGLSLASIVPVAFSLAGDLAPQRASAVSSFVTTLGYTGGLIGPALIGGLAELFGLRVALCTLIGTTLLIAGLASQLRRAPAEAGA